MTRKEFEAQYCSNCKNKLEKLFDKCKPLVLDNFDYLCCALFEPIKEEDNKNESRN